MEKRKTFLVFAIAMIVMIAMTIAFTSCSADRDTTSRRPTPTPNSELMRTPIDSTHQLERDYTTEQRTLPRKIPICVKRNKTELRPLGIVDDVMYLGINGNNELMFTSTRLTKNTECCVVGLPYIEGQNYFLSTRTDLKNVIIEETTEILYYN